jgi:hypothetical protein
VGALFSSINYEPERCDRLALLAFGHFKGLEEPHIDLVGFQSGSSTHTQSKNFFNPFRREYGYLVGFSSFLAMF